MYDLTNKPNSDELVRLERELLAERERRWALPDDTPDKELDPSYQITDELEDEILATLVPVPRDIAEKLAVKLRLLEYDLTAEGSVWRGIDSLRRDLGVEAEPYERG